MDADKYTYWHLHNSDKLLVLREYVESEVMMGTRKDKKGRVLRTGESQRERYYIYQYTDVTGKRRVIYAKDLPELRIKEKEIRKALEDGLDTYKMATQTLNNAFDAYFARRTDLKHASRMSYKYLYDHYVRIGFGNRKLAQIRYSDIKAFYLFLADENELSKNTISMLHSVLSQVFREAVRDGILRNNPAENVLTEFLRLNGLKEKKRFPLTVEQQSAFMEHLLKQPEFERWIPLLTVLLGTGCRIGEVLGLRWDDIDFETKSIKITHSLLHMTLSNGKLGFYISTPKSEAGHREIPMMSQVEQAFLQEKQLQEYRNKRVRGYKKPVVDGYTNFVFTDPKRKDGLLHAAIINNVLRQVTKSYNEQETIAAENENRKPVLLPDITCHHLRHTFCTRFCENETNLKVIQDIMGHASITTTMNKYVEATEVVKRQSMQNLENKILIF